jgi:capsule polysaccharide modification protein KpsS
VIGRGQEIEDSLPRTYNSVAVGNRHLGRGYALAGFYHPRSRYSEETDYVRMIHAYNETFSYWEDSLREHGVTLVVNGTLESAVICHKLGIPYRVLAGSRHKNLHFWAVNEYYEDPRINDVYKEILTSSSFDETQVEAQPYHSHMVNRTRFLQQGASLPAMIKNIGLQIARHAYWRLRGYAKARSYYLSSEINYYYRIWADFRRLERITKPLSSLDNQRFVFFPLHLEPESALQALSPEYLYQLSAITALSRDLPVGVYLALKETFAGIGRRPRDFYQQVADLKNVVFIDTMELGADVVRSAAAVATINGTAGMEAALEGKPVIVFGKHNLYECIPHVHRIDDESELKQTLANSLDGAIDYQANREAGTRYLAAVKQLSFDLGDYDFVNVAEFGDAVATTAADSLEQTLARPVEKKGRVVPA